MCFRNAYHAFLFFSFPQFNLSETQYRLHAKEVANSLDLSKYDGIVCVSGDGILVEVGSRYNMHYVLYCFSVENDKFFTYKKSCEMINTLNAISWLWKLPQKNGL